MVRKQWNPWLSVIFQTYKKIACPASTLPPFLASSHSHDQNQWSAVLNPLSPSIHVQILLTDLHTFSSRISWQNFEKRLQHFPLDTDFINSHSLFSWLGIDKLSLGENWCWSNGGPSLKYDHQHYCITFKT